MLTPVRSAFRRQIGRRYYTLKRLGLLCDVEQEIAAAEAAQLDNRLAQRAARQFLRAVGYHGRNRDRLDVALTDKIAATLVA